MAFQLSLPLEVVEATEFGYFDPGEENKMDDFLEICDLGDSKSNIQALEDVGNSYFHENDAFFDPCEDFFPSMILPEAVNTLDLMATHPYQAQGGFGKSVIQKGATHLTTQLWPYDMNPNLSAVLQPNQGVGATLLSYARKLLGFPQIKFSKIQEQGVNGEVVVKT